MIAALYVAKGGVYDGLEGVDAWSVERDARLYAGPWPVVAHPPCERWGAYWSGGPSAPVRRALGDDGGCFEAALAAVRRWCGVLEHPAGSRAWRAFDIIAPPRGGGWVAAGDGVGWTCHVEQGHYGHRARKATWLYAVGVELPSLRWGRCVGATRLASDELRRVARRLPAGASAGLRAARRVALVEMAEREGRAWCVPELMSKRERMATPPAFRDLLLAIARTASVAARREA